MESTNSVSLERLKRRQDFLAAKSGARFFGQAFVLQSRTRAKNQAGLNQRDAARFGITVTKKVGNAVVRNRIRRRLREAVRLNAITCAQSGNDYVLIAREASLHMDFTKLVDELLAGIRRVNKKNSSKSQCTHPISSSSMQNHCAERVNSSKQRNVTATTHFTGSQFHGK